ncbi:hypothetical protein FQN54_001836 [Arachnomyces sp. PD_36]|nr:hypothetical protein FQN54_001836 [Arachnomyces sp. PD_36]
MGSSSESRDHETEITNAPSVGFDQESPDAASGQGRQGLTPEAGEGVGRKQNDEQSSEFTRQGPEQLTPISPTSSVSRVTGSEAHNWDDVESPNHERRVSFSRVRLLDSSSPDPSSPDQRRPRRFSFVEDSETDPSPSPKTLPEDEESVTWGSLPKKGQLAILTVARLAEPLTQTSLQAYMFYQLKSFDPALPDSTIASRVGILQATFTGAQFLTAVMWGRIADSESVGRKKVLIVGLFGTGLSCVGVGFSKSYAVAAVFRTLGGALNSNVGVMRTMISEMVEKKYRPRAFLILPMCFNIGVIIGPIFGGLLADPVGNYPGIFGPGSVIGGEDGVWWMKHWPYALPNVLSGIFIIVAGIAVTLGLDETHEVVKYRRDWGRDLWRAIVKYLSFRRSPPKGYMPVSNDYQNVDSAPSFDLENSASRSVPPSPTTKGPRKRLTFRKIWTPNVLLTLVTHFLLGFHTSAFNALCFTFLPAPRASKESFHEGSFMHFGGGLGLSSSRVGLATAIIGIIGIPLQIFLYPRIQSRMGTLKSYRVFLPFSPLAYMLMPFLVLVPNHAWLVWPTLTAVLALQVISRTFSLPAAVILVNNSVPDRSVLGTVHGVAQSVASAARTFGPFMGGWGLGLGLQNNIVGAVWWALAAEAFLGWCLLWTIREGSGYDEPEAQHEDQPEENPRERPVR